MNQTFDILLFCWSSQSIVLYQELRRCNWLWGDNILS